MELTSKKRKLVDHLKSTLRIQIDDGAVTLCSHSFPALCVTYKDFAANHMRTERDLDPDIRFFSITINKALKLNWCLIFFFIKLKTLLCHHVMALEVNKVVLVVMPIILFYFLMYYLTWIENPSIENIITNYLILFEF